MKKATLYIVILGIACIGLGVALGAVLERHYTEKNFSRIARCRMLEHPKAGSWMKKGMKAGQKKGMEAGPEKIFQHISKKLDLSTEQNGQVEAILEENKQQVTQVRDAFKTDLEKIKGNCHTRILEVLSPEQKEKFEELTAKMEEKKEGMGLRHKGMRKN